MPTPRKKQLIFPLVLNDASEKGAIEDLSRYFRGSQSEVLRRVIEVLHEALVTKQPSVAQKWMLNEINERVKLAWEK